MVNHWEPVAGKVIFFWCFSRFFETMKVTDIREGQTNVIWLQDHPELRWVCNSGESTTIETSKDMICNWQVVTDDGNCNEPQSVAWMKSAEITKTETVYWTFNRRLHLNNPNSLVKTEASKLSCPKWKWYLLHFNFFTILWKVLY